MRALMFLLAFVTATSTRVETPEFFAELPGQWEKQSTGYKQAADTVFFTVSDAGRDRVGRVGDLRKKLIGDLARGRATFSATVRIEDRDAVYFSGEDPTNGKRFFVAVIGLPRAIITFAMYRPLEADSKGFDDVGKRIAWSVKEGAPASGRP